MMDVDDFLLKPGEQFGDYRIVSELGRGNNGVVYLAEQEPLDRKVALKILLPERSAHREYVELLLNEARSAARLCHPNIVQALDAGSYDERYFLAMEYVEGRTLEDIRLVSPELISLELLVELSIQLADALDYAWENFRISHGDIKPENLLVCNDNRTLKLADLGLANVSGNNPDEDEDGIMATPMYVAPEVISGTAERGMASDIYSFGVMFYELIAGKPPFRGDTEYLLRCHLEKPAPPLLVANPDIPAELAEFTHRMLEKYPAQRPQSWREIKDYLEDFRIRRLESLRQRTAEPPKPQGESPLPRLLLWSVVTLLVLVLLGGLGVMVWLIFFRTRI